MQRKKRSIATNFIYNMIYQVTLVILPLITSPYLSRTIGSEGLGEYSFSYSVAYYFYLFGMLGINNYGNRSIAAVRDNQEQVDYTFSRIYYFQLIISGVSTICYIIYCLFICSSNVLLALTQVFYVLSAVFSIDWFYFGIEEFRVTVIRKTIIKLVTSICIFVFVKSIQQLLLYSLIIAVAEFVGELYLWYYIPKFIHFKKVYIKDIFRSSKSIFVLFIPIIATSIYRYMDKIMLGLLGNMNDVGQYDYAEKIIMICLGCMTALGTVMLPKMANLIANHENEKVREYLSNSMQFAMFMGSAITFGLAAVGKRLAIVYFGSNFWLCGIAITYLAITVLPIAWANILRTQYLIPSAKDKEYLLSVIIGAIFNFFINFTLIPQLGLMGAIIGTIVAEFSVAIIQTVQVHKELDIGGFIKKSIPFLISGVIMYVATVLVGRKTQDNIVGLLLQIVVGGLSYITFSAGCCIKTKNELYTIIISRLYRKKVDK